MFCWESGPTDPYSVTNGHCKKTDDLIDNQFNGRTGYFQINIMYTSNMSGQGIRLHEIAGFFFASRSSSSQYLQMLLVYKKLLPKNG